MKIETYILCHNEELYIPYLVRHYSQFGKIIILENNSTDNTVELAKSLGCEVWIYDIPDHNGEKMLTEIREQCWRKSQADWVMIVDADEFIFHPLLLKILSETKDTIFEPEFINMFSEKFPTTTGQIYDEIKYGVPGGIWKSKMNIIAPRKIKRMNWHPGQHYADPVGEVRINLNSGIKTLHMKFLSKEYVIKNFKEQAARKIRMDLINGWGCQYQWSEQEINDFFDSNKPNLTKQL
jgi:glycosyltransferase involved in cell wall biosynthesis